MTISGILNIGKGALAVGQAQISTTGNNIANIDTQGYSRQSVLLKTNSSLTYSFGQLGQGVSALDIVRSYDRFVQSSLVTQLGSASKYDSAYYALRYIEDLFNESNVDGIGVTLTNMLEAWNDLAQNPDSLAARQALLGYAQSLSAFMQSTDSTLEAMIAELDNLIREEVNTANSLMTQIADLNRQIDLYSATGTTPNELLDKRDALTRQLAEVVDISVVDKGAGNYNITTGAGHILVQGSVAYSLTYSGPKAENALTANSPYKNSSGSGTVGFSGKDNVEYYIEVIQGGNIDGGATFRVSLDGGKTWMRDEDGEIIEFAANSENDYVTVGQLNIWFDAGEALATGDRFVISPKNDVYWNSPTSGPVNISSQFYGDGTENPLRITGGAIGGYLMARDQLVGSYLDDLNALAQSIIWEVNRIHSQGAGLTQFNYVLGDYQVTDSSKPLGSSASGNPWYSYLTEGNVSFSLYDATTGKPISAYPGIEVFSSINFDPTRDSLDDLVNAINSATFIDPDTGLTAVDGTNTPINPFKAEVVDGRLQITTTDPNYTFAVTSDTTGLLAALGINTFFNGTDASSIAVNSAIANDVSLINAGRVDGTGTVSAGDNVIANSIYELLTKSVNVNVGGKSTSSQSLMEFYSTLVTKVGSDTANVLTAAYREVMLAQNLSDRLEEIVGVSLDEELTNLIRFQSSYQAAAKLVTTADEMFQTILGMKQ